METKYYVKNEDNQKLYLNKEANKTLNDFNKVKKVISEMNVNRAKKKGEYDGWNNN